MKNFLSVHDVRDLNALIETGLACKREPLGQRLLGEGKRIGLLFSNPSMRTRVSTQLAARNLGLEPIVLNMGSEGWALEYQEGAIMNGTTVEHIKDAAPILGSYFDILCLRSFPKLQSLAEDEADTAIHALVRYAGRPVVSLESATVHPLQSLADCITIRETWKSTASKKRPKVVLTWAPHIKPIPQCVGNSFAQWMNAWGEVDFVVANPKGYDLLPKYTGKAMVIHDQLEALEGADYVYVKNWSSVEPYGQILGEHREWMLTEKHLPNPETKVMHCLPLRRNVELSDQVLDGPRSLLTRMAQNRVWSAQAVLSEILKNG